MCHHGHSHTDLSFVFPKVENVLSAEGNDGEKFAIFCQELHSIPPPNDGRYNMMGIKLWILTSPLRTWVDLAWALYRSCMDTALKEAKQNITVEEGEITSYVFNYTLHTSQVIN